MKSLLAIVIILSQFISDAYSSEGSGKLLTLSQIGSDNNGNDQLEIKNFSNDVVELNNWVDLKVCVMDGTGASFIERQELVIIDWASPTSTIVKINPGESVKVGVKGYWYKGKVMYWRDLVAEIKKDAVKIIGFIIVENEKKKSILDGQFIVFQSK